MNDTKILPKYIENKLLKIAINARKNKELMDEVEEYLYQKGYNIEELRDGDGCSLEEFEYGNFPIEAFCEKLKK